MPKELFRKVSLERLSSPEQLDQLMRFTTIKSWVTLFAIGCVLFAALVWGIFGSVPTRVYGKGMIMREEGVFAILVQGDGVVENVYARAGQEIQEGQLLATISQPEITDNIQSNQNILKELNAEYSEIQEIKESEEQLLKEGVISKLQFKETKNKLSAIKIKIYETEDKIKTLQTKLEQTSKVECPYTGILIEVSIDKGMVVDRGQSVGRIEITGKDLEAILYFSPSEGKKIFKGMPSHVSPSTVKEEEYGLMLGKVSFVSAFPMSQQGMMRILQNKELVANLMQNESPFEVKIDLTEDPNTLSKYKWSSKNGPPIEIHSGTLCSATVIVEKQRPVSLVIPLLKKHVLGIGEEK